MSSTAFLIVMLAAVLHATWNALVKGGGVKMLTTVLVVGAAAIIAICVLPFLAAPASASWPQIVVSGVLHVAYFTLVARSYDLADMSQAYPLMRGTAPLLVALVSALFFGERLSGIVWLGIGVICAGILAMASGIRRDDARGAALALTTAVFIAAYTLVDGAGARRAGASTSYTLWGFLLPGAPLVAWATATRRTALAAFVARDWYRGAIGGAGTVGSYALVLGAMTIAPVAVVAALRETAILFGVAISGLILREPVGPVRIAAACVIAGGVIILRLG